MSSLTNIWFPEDKRDELKEALEHYRFPTAAAFFRICGLALIEHHKRGASLNTPLSFLQGRHNGCQKAKTV
jgi:hypothetical protein